MTFLAPWVLAAGLAASAVIVALHLLTTRRPPAAPLPTARFVPEGDVRAVARASRPTDLMLLALRVLAVMAVALAFAQPVPNAPGDRVRRVVALEWTTALTDVERARATAKAKLARGDALVVFDTAARILPAEALDSLPAPTVRQAKLSPMFVAAREAGTRIARGADSVELDVLAGLGPDVMDAATRPLRLRWPGRVDLVSLAIVADTAMATRIEMTDALPNDPIAPALANLTLARGAHELRFARAAPRPLDAAWVREAKDAVLLRWPVTPPDSAARPDGVVLLDGMVTTLVAPLVRMPVPEGRVVARWRDGTPAVTEVRYAGGCERFVGVGLPAGGDLTLRPAFERFLLAMLAPCGGARRPALDPTDSAQAWLSRTGPLAAGPVLASLAEESSPWTRWLLVAGMLILTLEQLLRRTRRAEEAR